MSIVLKVRKIGNSLGVILPKSAQKSLNIAENDLLDMTILENNKIIIELHLPHHDQWDFSDYQLTTEDKEWLEADLEDEQDEP